MSSKGLGTLSGNLKWENTPSFYENEVDKDDLQYFIDLLYDKHFLGLATWRYQWLAFSRMEFNNAAKEAQNILELIRSELKL